MRFNAISLLKRLLDRSDDQGSFVSMVFLMRKARPLQEITLVRAVETGWHVSYTQDTSEAYVSTNNEKAVVYVRPHLITLLIGRNPYTASTLSKSNAESLSSTQRAALEQHTGWMSIDYQSGTADVELAYSVLARLGAELVDSDCVGIYIPGESSLIPNDGSLAEELRRLAAVRL